MHDSKKKKKAFPFSFPSVDYKSGIFSTTYVIIGRNLGISGLSDSHGFSLVTIYMQVCFCSSCTSIIHLQWTNRKVENKAAKPSSEQHCTFKMKFSF